MVDNDIARQARPGQFVMVSFPGSTDPLLGRPFAIYDITDDGIVWILFKRVGKGTTLLSRLRPGDTLRIVGPLGRGFSLFEGIEEALIIAGGAGIASVRLLMKECLRQGLPTRLLYGARTSEELIGLHDLGTMGVRLYFATEDGSSGHKGLVTDLVAAVVLKDPRLVTRALYAFVAGPFAMVASVVPMLGRAGIRGQCSLESVMACGYGVCQGCVVKTARKADGSMEYARVCAEGPVFLFEEIDWE